ncbi:MAG: hypothetical protein M3N08_10145 [Pseudomonadota bacterium]|nr:hypothetical protein [Pseudomonadota bacterium]
MNKTTTTRNRAIFAAGAVLLSVSAASAYAGTDAPSAYSAQQYPTAQGHYLTLPSGYQTADAAPKAAIARQPAITQQVLAQPQPVHQDTVVVYSDRKPLAAAAGIDTTPAPQPVTVDQLPSYSYKNQTAPQTMRSGVAVPTKLHPGKQISLQTLSGSQVGLQISNYRYQEHTEAETDFVRETGPKFGLTYDFNGIFPRGYFIDLGLRAAYGENHYTGSGTASGIPDWIFDARVTGGIDLDFENAIWGITSFDVSPYAGLGFRYLYNNFATIAGGYDRYSHYLYLPVGVTPRFRITEQSRLSINLEYDQLLYGWQVSQLSDNNPGAPDLTSPQYRGYGLRTSAMWEWPKWSVGPYLEYWNIAKSDIGCASGSTITVCGDEPSNQTLEIGVQGRYRF